MAKYLLQRAVPRRPGRAPGARCASPFALSVLLVVGLLLSSGPALGVTLQSGTATFSQTCSGLPHSPDLSVDGDLTSGNRGWAIFSASACSSTGGFTASQTAVWETAADVTAAQLNFALIQNFTLTDHLIGRFRLSITSDDRSLFADGLDTGGDVTATWTVLTSPVVSGPAGMTFTTQGDNSILVSGTIPGTATTYDVSYSGSFSSVTGIRLEAIADASLPDSGPGMAANGNFILTEITLNVAEPSAAILFFFGALLVGAALRRSRAAV